MTVDSEVKRAAVPLTLVHTIYQDGVVKARARALLAPGSGRLKDSQELIVPQAELWSPKQPRLYRLVTELTEAATGQAVDWVEQKIGLKEVVLKPEEGLILNGCRLKLNGVCEHHDLGALGAAFSKSALRFRLHLLKRMGVNAIRTGHSVPAKGFMELADELGFW